MSYRYSFRMNLLVGAALGAIATAPAFAAAPGNQSGAVMAPE